VESGILKGSVVYPAPEESGGGLYAELPGFLEQAKALATVPVSGYRVGAAVLAESGKIYLGANQEFAGLPLNFTVHAEQAAVVNARAHGEKRLTALAVSSAPCGYCRQFLKELMTPLTVVLNGQARPLADFLPQSFSLDSGGESLLSGSKALSAETPEEAAVQAARVSYSPYTGTKSGAALLCRSGKIYAGWLLESSAYNPSLTALQTALTLRALDAPHGGEIVEAVLAESGAAPCAPLFPALMAVIAPQAAVRVIATEI
jgi:cytidine deaminase